MVIGGQVNLPILPGQSARGILYRPFAISNPIQASLLGVTMSSLYAKMSDPLRPGPAPSIPIDRNRLGVKK